MVAARPRTGVVTVGLNNVADIFLSIYCSSLYVGRVAALIDIPAALVRHPDLVPGVTLALVRRVGSPTLLVNTVRVGVAVGTEIFTQ